MRCDSGLERPRRSDSPPAGWSSWNDEAIGRASKSNFPNLTSIRHGRDKHHDPRPYFSYPQISMDPLTLTTSVVTVVGAVIAVAKLIDKLSVALRETSSDLCALSNEISDFRVVLEAITGVLREWEAGKHPRPQTDMGLSHILEKSEKQLMGLNNLILSCLINPHMTSDIRPDKLKWMRERKRIKAAQNGIRDRKQDLTTLIGVYNLSGMAKLNISINQISLGMDHIHAEQKQRTERQKLHAPALDQLPGPFGEKELLDSQLATESAEISGISAQEFPSTPNGLLSIIQDADLIRVQVSFHHQRNSCRVLCSCQCHQKRSIANAGFTKRFIGSLFVGYSCLPFVAAKCNEKKCRRRNTRIAVSYQFPKWFWAQQLFKATLTTGAISGPEMILRVQRTYPFSSEIYQYCMDGNVSGLKRLFESRIISPYDVDPEGRSLIHNALRGKNTHAACQLFITAGADVYQEDQFGHSAIHAAWDSVLLAGVGPKQDQEIVELFPLGEGGLDDRDFSRFHKLVLGIIASPLKSELEISTAHIDQGDSLGRTPLFWAASRGDVTSVSLLLEYGADPRIPCSRGSPLTVAAGGGHAEVATMLLEYGAEVNGRCSEFRTPLIEASRSMDNNDCIEILLKHGADINAQDCHDECAVLEAAMNGNLQNLKVLLAHGADLNIPEQDGWTPLASTIFWMERPTSLCIRELINAGANYLLVTHAGENILHNAAQYGGLPTLRTLIETNISKLDPYARTHAGMTPQDLADCRTDVDDEWREAFSALLATTGITDTVDNSSGSISILKSEAVHIYDNPVTVSTIELAYEGSDDEVQIFEDALE